MQSNILEVQQLSKTFDGSATGPGLRDVNLSLQTGEIVCVLGPSGSGKSTLLRTLARLETPSSGLVKKANAAVEVGFVPQDYTLWPHMTVLQNLTLAPVLRGGDWHTGPSVQRQALSLLERFGLLAEQHRYPHELSGGQKQRVALLRACMMRPQILLLDEVTSSLDPELTKSVHDLIRALAKDGHTMVIVTHHLSFAMSVADRVLFLKDGTIKKDESTEQFFTAQQDTEIMSYIMELARKDESIEVFKGVEQFQAYHMGLIKRLPRNSVIHIAGGVGDAWYAPMGEFYDNYEKIRLEKNITWKSVMYEQGTIDRRLIRGDSSLNQFRLMPRNIKNPANYNVFQDTVITQIFTTQPTIIQIKNQHIADAYLRFFEELWDASKETNE